MGTGCPGDPAFKVGGQPGYVSEPLPGVCRNVGKPGVVGVRRSPAKLGRVRTTVGAGDRGLYRYEDQGYSRGWSPTNRGLEERPWYHQHGFADPRDADSEGGPYRSSPPAPPRRRFRGHWQLSRRRQPAPLRPRHRKTGTVDGHSSVEDAAPGGVHLARRSNHARPPENLDLTRGCGCAQR